VEYYINHGYQEALDNLTLGDVYLGTYEGVRTRREKII
jgi:hypothetical protein